MKFMRKYVCTDVLAFIFNTMSIKLSVDQYQNFNLDVSSAVVHRFIYIIILNKFHYKKYIIAKADFAQTETKRPVK